MPKDAPDLTEDFCPRYHHAVELIGRRWNGVILRALLAGHTRYAAIREAVPNLSDTLLSQRLRELEGEGIITREVAPTTPVQITYKLAPKGIALQAAVREIERWSHEWIPVHPEPTTRA